MPPVYVKFNGEITYIETGFGQFYDESSGMRRLVKEIEEMKIFPNCFPVSLSQNKSNGNVIFTIHMTVRSIIHKITLTYDQDHPQYQIEAIIEYPVLDMSRMYGHWYGVDKPCYIENWTRAWTALKVATQMRFWLEDYYNGDYARRYDASYDRTDLNHVLAEARRNVAELERRNKQSFWRFW